jgi:hypothetical protein
MLNLFQHLEKSMDYETLKQVQGDTLFYTCHSERGSESQVHIDTFQILNRLMCMQYLCNYVQSVS